MCLDATQAAAYSLQLKLSQGLDLSGGGNKREERGGGTRGGRNDSEISASVEVLLQEPELVLQDPTSSLTGQALQGLLVAEVSSRVRRKMCFWCVFEPPMQTSLQCVCVCVCVCVCGCVCGLCI